MPDHPELLLPAPTTLEWFGIGYRPDDDLHRYRPFERPPAGLVVHSGDRAAWVGPFITNDPGCYAYHAAWFPGEGLLQTAPLDLRIYHGGKGNDWLSVGLSGPWDQDPRDSVELQALLHFAIVCRVTYAPVFRFWCRHSDYDQKKKDPGPGVTAELMSMAGLAWGLPPGC